MVNIPDMNFKKICNRKMGSPCSFTRQQALKTGNFYWLCVKNSNHLHSDISVGYTEDNKFYLESRASFIHIGNIATFKPFFFRLGERILYFFGQCNGQLKVLVLAKIHPVESQFPKEKKKSSSPTIKLFSFSNMFFIWLFLANTWTKKKKNSGVTVLV